MARVRLDVLTESVHPSIGVDGLVLHHLTNGPVHSIVEGLFFWVASVCPRVLPRVDEQQCYDINSTSPSRDVEDWRRAGLARLASIAAR